MIELKTVPEIIKAASASILGILALVILVVALFGFYFFRDSTVGYRFGVFLLVFVGAGAFAFAVLSAQRDDALRAQAELLPELRLTLAFSGKEAPNPKHAKVNVYVQPKSDSEGSYADQQHFRKDIHGVPGPGGISLAFPKLNVGDVVYVEVEDQGKKWQSYAMRMLEANLQMVQEEGAQ